MRRSWQALSSNGFYQPLMRRCPLSQWLPLARSVAIANANLKVVNRVNLPQRDTFRIASDWHTISTRNVTRIKELLASYANQCPSPSYLVYVFCRPFDGPVMGRHFSHYAGAFLLIHNRFRVGRLRLVRCVNEGNMNIVKYRLIGYATFTVYALASLLSGDQNKRFQSYELALAKSG
jgi:hypothetical protein